jgi:XRE family transcriptional regulator, regulator of sulfur utilization
MPTNAADWLAKQEAADGAAQAELRHRVEEGVLLGLQFRDARKSLGLSQSEVAERAGIRQADVSQIERGVGNPTSETLARLAKAVDRRLELV